MDNNKRKNEKEINYDDNHSDSSSDMDEEELLDVTKLKKDIQNQEQINPQQPYNAINQPKLTEQQKKELELEEQEEAKQEDFDLVNVDLNFYDPNEKQFHSVKVLTNGYLDGLSFNSSELADLIVKQGIVGTMVGVDDPEETTTQNIFGFTTTLPLQQYQNVKVIQEICNFVQEKSLKHNSKHQQLMNVLQNNGKIGLLINERIMNCSPFVVPTLHQQFYEDLKWVYKEKTQEATSFKFEYLLVLSKVYKASLKQKQTASQKKKKINNELEEYIYQKFEDYRFLQKSENFFMFEADNTKSGGAVTNHQQDVKEQVCYRTVYLLKWDDYVNTIPLLPQELIPLAEIQQMYQNK